VATASHNVKDMAANTGVEFTLTAKGAGVVAWRYKPFQQ
jgi:hypothetical protein